MKGNVVGQGGIPRQGDNVALASSVVGTTLKLRAPKGLYDGIDDTVNLANVFTTLGAKRFATGLATSGNTATNFSRADTGGDVSRAVFNVNGLSLSFTPRTIIVFSSTTVQTGSVTVYNADYTQMSSNGNALISVNGYKFRTAGTTVGTTGFVLPVQNYNEQHRWIAFE